MIYGLFYSRSCINKEFEMKAKTERLKFMNGPNGTPDIYCA